MKPSDLKLVVKEKYGEIANQSYLQNKTSCCGASSNCCDTTYTIFADDYSELQGYNADADLALGCGIPTAYTSIKGGNWVLDLGSGAGNDCFVARSFVGDSGKVVGIDFTPQMVEKARKNVQKLGFTNVEFIEGDIEEMPLAENQFDIVISNCVLNLVPNKQKAFSEIHRVLKPNGSFAISDVVLIGNLPEKLLNDAVMYAGCVSGALEKSEYLQIVSDTGFKNIEVKKEKRIEIPDEILKNYLTDNELETFKNGTKGIFSITVTANK